MRLIFPSASNSARALWPVVLVTTPAFWNSLPCVMASFAQFGMTLNSASMATFSEIAALSGLIPCSARNRRPQWWILGVNVATLFAVGWYALVTHWQWRDQARNHKITQRAWMVPTVAEIQDFSPGKNLQLIEHAWNNGQTPAKDVTMVGKVKMWQDGEKEPPSESKVRPTDFKGSLVRTLDRRERKSPYFLRR
jgi:hypothetical protein